MASGGAVAMTRYLRLLWLLVSSLCSGFVGFMLALTIMLPFILRYSSEFIKTPLWVRLLMGMLGYGLPIVFFVANFVRLWRWADEYPSASDAKNQTKVKIVESKD